MTAAIQPQPAKCHACGAPFAEPFCDHVRLAFAALAADPRELRTVEDYYADADQILAVDRLLTEAEAIIADPPARRRYTSADLRRGYCPTAAYNVVRR